MVNNSPRSEVMIGYPNTLKINFDEYMEKLLILNLIMLK